MRVQCQGVTGLIDSTDGPSGDAWTHDLRRFPHTQGKPTVGTTPSEYPGGNTRWPCMSPREFILYEMADSPFGQDGRMSRSITICSTDGTSVHAFTTEDVARVIAYGEDSWSQVDGVTAAVLELRDGRFASWESWWNHTYSGFDSEFDGDPPAVFVSRTEDAAIALISEDKRGMLKPPAM